MTTFVEYLDKHKVSYDQLGDTLTVNSFLFIREDIDSFPGTVIINGELTAIENVKLAHLPKTLVVNGACDFSFANINDLPENLVVASTLDIRYTAITSIPQKFQCKNLCMIPEDITNIVFVRKGDLVLAALVVNGKLCINFETFLYPLEKFNTEIDAMIAHNGENKAACVDLKTHANLLAEQYVDKFL